MKKILEEELKNILDDHKLWLDSDKQKGKCANLSNTDLSRMNLSYVDLTYADLSGTDLFRVNLSYANLFNANLSYANLSDANLFNVILSYADLSHVNLFCADLSDANLSYANLSYANLAHANLYHTNIIYADLSNTVLIKTKLREVVTQNIIGKKIIAAQIKTSRKNNLVSYWVDLGIWTTGCFQGTLKELKKAVEETHKDNLFLKNRYFRAIDYILNEAEEDKNNKRG